MAERKASWAEAVVAIATVAQTLLIAVGLVVAYVEFVGHHAADERQRRDASIKMFAEPLAEEVSRSRSFVASIAGYAICVRKKLGDEACKAYGGTALDDMASYLERSGPWRRHLETRAICVDIDICDTSLSMKLTCDDLLMLADADHFAEDNMAATLGSKTPSGTSDNKLMWSPDDTTAMFKMLEDLSYAGSALNAMTDTCRKQSGQSKS